MSDKIIKGSLEVEDRVSSPTFDADSGDNYGIVYGDNYILGYDYRAGQFKEAYLTLPAGSGDFVLATEEFVKNGTIKLISEVISTEALEPLTISEIYELYAPNGDASTKFAKVTYTLPDGSGAQEVHSEELMILHMFSARNIRTGEQRYYIYAKPLKSEKYYFEASYNSNDHILSEITAATIFSPANKKSLIPEAANVAIPLLDTTINGESTITLADLYELLVKDYGNFAYLKVNRQYLLETNNNGAGLARKYYAPSIPDTQDVLMFVSMVRTDINANLETDDSSDDSSDDVIPEYRYSIYIKPVYPHDEDGYFYWVGNKLYGDAKIINILRDGQKLYLRIHNQDDWPGIEVLDLRNMTTTD